MRVAWVIGCIVAVLASIAAAVATARFGVVPLAVTSGSMEPAMPAHSLILVTEVDPDDVRVGEIITFDPPGPTPRVTHRVVARERREARWFFKTKGDANPAADDWRRTTARPERQDSQITYGDRPAIRHVATIPHLGWISAIGAFPRLRSVLVVLPFAWVGICLLIAIWRPREASPVAPIEEAEARDAEVVAQHEDA